MAGFERFTKQHGAPRGGVFVSVTGDGETTPFNLGVSTDAMIAIGTPSHAQLLCDPERRLIAIRACKENDPDAYTLRAPSARTAARVVTCSALFRHYGINGGAAKGRHEAEVIDGDTVVIALPEAAWAS